MYTTLRAIQVQEIAHLDMRDLSFRRICLFAVLLNTSSKPTIVTAYHATRQHAASFISYSSNTRDEQLAIVSSLTTLFAKGFAGTSAGGFGTKAQKKPTPAPSKQAVMKRLQKTYGGTSPQEIAQATQQIVEQTLQELTPHMYMAVQLYRKLKQWDAQMTRLSLLQQANLNEQDVKAAQRGRTELQDIMTEHSITEGDIHNVLQRATWDASADAKAARSLTGAMPKDIVQRVDRACTVLAEQKKDDSARYLDVGCGYGVLIPHLVKAGLKLEQIHGVDLSQEMIRNAKELHPGVDFRTADFLNDHDGMGCFDGIIFCSALHDFPDPFDAIGRAASLLRANGTLVVVHAQGGMHVANQVDANPVLVRRGLPNARELVDLGNIGLELVYEPADAGSIRDVDEGYLAVLRKL